MAPRSLLALAFAVVTATLPASALPDQGIETAALDDPEAYWLTTPTVDRTTNGLGVHDPIGDRVIVFGGLKGLLPVNETQVLSLSGTPQWSVMGTQSPPGPRHGHTGIYDPLGHQMVVFGGWDVPNDVWVLPLAGPPIWKELHPGGTAPGPMHDHAAVYDGRRRRMIVIDPRMHVWSLTLGTAPRWEEIVVGGAGRPTPRGGHRVVHDPIQDRLIVFGGGAGDHLWELRFSPTPEWVLLSPPSPLPSNRSHHNLVLDPIRNRMLLYGGTPHRPGTWALALTGEARWTQLATSGPNPGSRISTWAIYDPRRDRLVIPGYDTGGTPDAFSLSLGDLVWVEHARRDVGERWSFAMLHDSARDRIILHGGDATNSISTWSLDLGNRFWSPLAVDGPAPPMTQVLGIYDPIGDRAVIFGSGQVWALSFATARWSLLSSEGAPPSDRAAVAFDPRRRRMLVAGGVDGTGYVRTLGAFSLETHQWTVTQPGNAQPRGSPALIYDPVRDRLVLHGGQTGSHPGGAPITSKDVYTLQLDDPSSSWRLVFSGGPSDRFEHAAAYDPIKHRMIVFSGRPGLNSSGNFYPPDPEVWGLELGPGSWRRITLAEALGETPYGYRAVFDPRRSQYVIYGGSLQARMASLQISRPLETVPIDISPGDPGNVIDPGSRRNIAVGIFSTTSFDATAVDLLTLRLAQAPVATRGVDPMRIMDLNQDGRDDVLVYFVPPFDLAPDASIAFLAGRTWTNQPIQGADGVRLGRRGTAHAERGGAPTESPLAIRSITPNPARGPLRVAWSVSVPGAVRIEMLDVAGRRVWSRDLTGWTAGEHQITVEPGRSLRAGVYWLRISSGASSASQRIAVLD